MNLPGKRLLLGTAIATAALGAGGLAYAAGDDPSPQQGYVTIEDGATTPSPGTPDGTAPQQGTPEQGQRNGADCPEKDGTGGSGQGQGEPSQEPSQADPQSNA